MEMGKKIASQRTRSQVWYYQFTKGKGDPMECGSYRGMKLLQHAMKVRERIFKNRIRQQNDIVDMQFGFMKGKVTFDATFIVRQMQKNFRAKGNKFYFGFVDLE